MECFQSIYVWGSHAGGSPEQYQSFGLGFRVQGSGFKMYDLAVIWNSTEIKFYGLVLSNIDCISGTAHVFGLKI